MRWKISAVGVVFVSAMFVLQSGDKPAQSVVTSNANVMDGNQDADPEIATEVMAAELLQQQVADALTPAGVDYLLSEETLLLFDNLIAETEQKSLSVLLNTLQQWMEQATLNSASQDMLQDVFSRYIDYKRALREVKSSGHEAYLSSAHLTDTLEALDDLRYSWFSVEEIALLFSERKAHDDNALARLRIREDSSLSEQEKNRLIAQSIEQLPEAQQAAFQPSLQIRKVQQLKAETSELPREQRLARLSAEFGQEVGQRLDNVYAQQNKWNNRVENLRKKINSLEGNEQLSLDERSEQILALKTSLFDEGELKRLDVFLRNPELLN